MAPKTKAVKTKASTHFEAKKIEDNSANDTPVIMATGSDNGASLSMAPNCDSVSVKKPKKPKKNRRKGRAQKKKADRRRARQLRELKKKAAEVKTETLSMAPTGDSASVKKPKASKNIKRRARAQKKRAAGKEKPEDFLSALDIGEPSTSTAIETVKEEEVYDFGGPLKFYYATTEEEWRRDNMLSSSDMELGAAAYCGNPDPNCECDICFAFHAILMCFSEKTR